MKSSISLVIADDHRMIREGYRSMLSGHPQISICGEAANGKELCELLHHVSADIVLMDLEMPVMGGYDAIRKIHAEHPSIRIIIVSMHNSSGMIAHFLLNGARGFILKEKSFDEVIHAVLSVHRHGYYFNEIISQTLVSSLLQGHKLRSEIEALSLSNRELEILKGVCAGASNQQIAARLSISIHTVDFHRKNIYSKTELSNVVDLVKYAIKQGIVPL